jgi:transcriptional regulator with XRE-family HTH domain
MHFDLLLFLSLRIKKKYIMNQINTLLARKGVTRREVAEGIGVSFQMMHNYCNEQAKIPGKVLVAISNFLDVGIEELEYEEPRSREAEDIDARIAKLKVDIDDILQKMDSITYRHPDFDSLTSRLSANRIRLHNLERQREKYYSAPDTEEAMEEGEDN